MEGEFSFREGRGVAACSDVCSEVVLSAVDDVEGSVCVGGLLVLVDRPGMVEDGLELVGEVLC